MTNNIKTPALKSITFEAAAENLSQIAAALNARLENELAAIEALKSAGISTNSKPAKEIAPALNALQYVDARFYALGAQKIAKVLKCEISDIYAKLEISDKSDAHFMPMKSLAKFVRLIAVLGGATNADVLKSKVSILDKFQNATFRGIIDGYAKIKKCGFYDKVFSSDCSLQELKLCISYRGALDSGDTYWTLANELIEKGVPDFHTSTANTQGSQIVSYCRAIGLCKAVKNGQVLAGNKAANHARIVWIPEFIQLLKDIDKKTPFVYLASFE